MADGSVLPLGLSFPRSTFAKLTPGRFLHTYLQQPSSIRPNGRKPDEFRTPVVNTGSLTHSNGSAVVRVGDTAIVCGVRGEILLASDIPRPPGPETREEDMIEELGLLVPNIELSTGCSPAYLPGSPPTAVAQALSYRIMSLLREANMISIDDLMIQYMLPDQGEDDPEQGARVAVKAYWTLYIDILCIALDGNPFDAAWTAVMAALQDTLLPKAWWDPDNESILCSPMPADAHRLRIGGLPVVATFAVFSTASPLKQAVEAENWVLADPDALEEDVCSEKLTLAVLRDMQGKIKVITIEKSGGAAIGMDLMRDCLELAGQRCKDWEAVLTGG